MSKSYEVPQVFLAEFYGEEGSMTGLAKKASLGVGRSDFKIAAAAPIMVTPTFFYGK